MNVGSHWVTLSNLSSGPNEVCLYDSLNYTINEQAQRTIAYMARNFIQGPVLGVIRKGVHQQQGYDDCGPTVIEFAHSLCSGNDPNGCNYTQKLLREAVIHSLSHKDIDIPMTTAKVTYSLFAVAQLFYLWMLMFKGARRLWSHKHRRLVRLQA